MDKKDDDVYFDFDMTDAVRGIPPQITQRQTAKHTPNQQHQTSLIEPDVWQLINQNANQPNQIAKINGMLRLLLT